MSKVVGEIEGDKVGSEEPPLFRGRTSSQPGFVPRLSALQSSPRPLLVGVLGSATDHDSCNQVPFPEFFPNGMVPVIEYLHGLGIKFGLYTSVGDKTCHGGWSPGSLGHFEQDAQTFGACVAGRQLPNPNPNPPQDYRQNRQSMPPGQCYCIYSVLR